MSELNEVGKRIVAAALTLNVSVPDLSSKLAQMGITGPSTELLDDDELFKFGDFREAFKDKGIVIIRKAFRDLKGGKKPTQEDAPGTENGGNERLNQLQKLYGYKPKLKDVDTAALLAIYTPDKPNDPVTVALRERFGEKSVIAFDDDGKVNIAATTEYTSGLEQGFPEAETVTVNGQLIKLWPVGTKPDVMVDEDPLFPGNPLRNGVSLINHRNWSKVEIRERQFCRLVLEQGAVDPNNHEAVLRLLERAQDSSTTDSGKRFRLIEAYPAIDLLFRAKAKLDDLPKLKIQLGKTSRPQNPFGVKRQY